MEENFKEGKAISLTYLVKASFASLNGSDNDAGNISNIKKISCGTDEYPYVSSQAIRRSMRTQMEVLGKEMSESVVSTIEKGAATTKQNPVKYIDDDLFGYMGTISADDKNKGKSVTRTSPVRVSPLISVVPYYGDLDFGTNFMSKNIEGNPNIFETEIHSGIYRGSILIELDRVGTGSGFESKSLDNKEKSERVKCLLDVIKNLWTTGRQTRFLSDTSPKFVAAAILKTKNSIFQESVILDRNKVNSDILKNVMSDYKPEIIASVIGTLCGIIDIDIPEKKTIGASFEEMKRWVDLHYK